MLIFIKIVLLHILLLFVKENCCELHCGLSNLILDSIQCHPVGVKDNTIQPTGQTRYNTIATTLVDIFSEFDWSNIKGFIIKDAYLIDIHMSVFANASSLTHLDFSGNPKAAMSFRDIFPLIPNLRSLQLRGSSAVLGPEISLVPQLRFLDATNVGIAYFNYNWDINSLNDLEILYMSLPSEFQTTDFTKFKPGKKLIYLDVSNSTLILEPRCFKNATRLRTLVMSHSKLTDLPRNIFDGSQITDIDLSFNCLPYDSISKLSWSMVRVNMSHNCIKDLARYNYLYSSLQVLDISHNDIDHMHSYTFGQTEELFALYLSHNKISTMNYKLFYRAKRLRILDLSYNLLSDIPALLFAGLNELDTLNLSGNLIKSLEPYLFKDNAIMRWVSFSHNKLESFDILTFANLNETRVLDFSNNLLRSLPNDLLHLGNILELRLSCNRLTSLPLEFFEATADYSDWVVYLQGNPWSCGCVNRIIEVLENYQFNQQYFNDISHMSCYVGSYAPDLNNNVCNERNLTDSELFDWSKALETSGIVC